VGRNKGQISTASIVYLCLSSCCPMRACPGAASGQTGDRDGQQGSSNEAWMQLQGRMPSGATAQTAWQPKLRAVNPTPTSICCTSSMSYWVTNERDQPRRPARAVRPTLQGSGFGLARLLMLACRGTLLQQQAWQQQQHVLAVNRDALRSSISRSPQSTSSPRCRWQ